MPRYAFLGVRPCDLRAITIQDRVLAHPGSRYAARRDRLFIIVVNCTEPGETCFCTSMGTGPGVRDPGYDLALTQLVDDRGHRFLVETGSQQGVDILWQVRSRGADDPTVEQARSAVEAAAGRMGRQMQADGLRDLMADSHQAARWDDVASRCLSCGNCTMACPTCFDTIEDTTDLTGSTRSAGSSGIPATTLTSPTSLAAASGHRRRAGTGSGSRTSSAPGMTSSAPPAASAAAGASSGARPASTSPRKSRPCAPNGRSAAARGKGHDVHPGARGHGRHAPRADATGPLRGGGAPC